MVTNAHPVTLEIKMEQVDITRWFDRVVVSHDLEAPKEDQTFWHKLQALHPFDPSRTLLIDDTESVLDSARAYGIAHLLTLLQPFIYRRYLDYGVFESLREMKQKIAMEVKRRGIEKNIKLGAGGIRE